MTGLRSTVRGRSSLHHLWGGRRPVASEGTLGEVLIRESTWLGVALASCGDVRSRTLTAQAGGCYGVKTQQGSGSSWLLISGATLVESAYMAAERAPSSPQVLASFSRPLRVQRPGPKLFHAAHATRLGSNGQGPVWSLGCLAASDEEGVAVAEGPCLGDRTAKVSTIELRKTFFDS